MLNAPGPTATVRLGALVGALAIAVAPAAARSEAAPYPLRYDLRVDGVVTAGAWAAWAISELAKEHLAPSACRACSPNGLDAGARDLLVWDDRDRARYASDAVLALVPAGIVAHQLLAARAAGDTNAGFVDLLLVLEAAGLTVDLTQVAKFAVGRQRPSARYGGASRAPEPGDNLSFHSSHAALAFSLAASAGTVSSLRGYRSAPWVWAVGMSLAALTAYLRVAADEHYLTDVLAGAAVGTAVGVAVPRLLHGREPDGANGRPALVLLPLGVRAIF